MRLDKKKRHTLIKSIIETKEISTQFDLRKELLKRGVTINQPTISRDLREMAAIKAARGFGKFIYQIPPAEEMVSDDELKNKFMHSVKEINHTGSIIIIKTPPGEAQGVAKVIDAAKIKTILGTVAGDDTIIVIVDKKPHVKKVLTLFERTRGVSE
jgi:transcriptional regulator of arginine metabolism